MPGHTQEVSGTVVRLEQIANSTQPRVRRYAAVKLENGFTVQARVYGNVTLVPGDHAAFLEITTPLLGFKRYRFHRHLNPNRFRSVIPWNGIPPDIPFLSGVRHTAALARLHPRSNEAHQRLCKWLDVELAKQNPSNGASENSSNEQEQSRDAILADPRKNDQFDYEYRAKSEIKKASLNDHFKTGH